MEKIILPISSQGQITIPKKWRQYFLKSDKVRATLQEDGTLLLQSHTQDWVEESHGLLAKK
ncbi:MAG: hypothetical protein KatS3mg087_0179 [Patescibacteria group bacterium]|jgi:bifunctional DNA-binding transcriptional regulator/antitoxin component of YhaV-PrlF toxin-antitoxin module|nr:MAG: hypothetical protein KatS3mg087_0179 [Patescibacteria group bacterium]